MIHAVAKKIPCFVVISLAVVLLLVNAAIPASTASANTAGAWDDWKWCHFSNLEREVNGMYEVWNCRFCYRIKHREQCRYWTKKILHLT